MCRFVGTVPDMLGLVRLSFRPKSGSKSKIPARIQKICRGPLSSAELGSSETKTGPEKWTSPQTSGLDPSLDPQSTTHYVLPNIEGDRPGSSKTYPYPQFLAWGRKSSIWGV